MGSVQNYRRSATECLALADLVSNPGDRAMLVAMAARWYDLAEKVGKHGDAHGFPNPHQERRSRFRVVSGSKAPSPPPKRDR